MPAAERDADHALRSDDERSWSEFRRCGGGEWICGAAWIPAAEHYYLAVHEEALRVAYADGSHPAVIKFVENRFIGSTTHLTPRDAAQPNLLEFFDFSTPPWAAPPTPPSPVTEESLGYDPCTPTSMGPVAI